jgi:hypothetical protein
MTTWTRYSDGVVMIGRIWRGVCGYGRRMSAFEVSCYKGERWFKCIAPALSRTEPEQGKDGGE